MPSAYSCRTLTGNWYEERLADAPQLGGPESAVKVGQDFSVRQQEPDTFRTQTVDISTSNSPYKAADTIRSCITTKQDMEGHLVNIQPPVQKIKMVNQHNLREVFKAHRVVDRPVKGFGALLPAPDMSEVPEALTTNQHFYDKLPNKAIRARSGDFQQPTSRHCSAGRLFKDSHTIQESPAMPSGRSGLRGELTRHPGEAGSMYGVSTFVDEYATWGAQLLGKTRGDVDAKRLTQHFNA